MTMSTGNVPQTLEFILIPFSNINECKLAHKVLKDTSDHSKHTKVTEISKDSRVLEILSLI